MARQVTLEEAETARQRGVTGLDNLGIEDVNDIEGMDAADFADFKGWELVNPPKDKRRKINSTRLEGTKMPKTLKQQLDDANDRIEELEDFISSKIDDFGEVLEEDEEEDDDDTEE
jgi:hypothetical protein